MTSRETSNQSVAARMSATIKDICGFTKRAPGSNSERETALYICERITQLGREAVIEPIRIRPKYALAHALTVAVAIAGAITAVKIPSLGVVILLLACISMFGDLTSRFHILRKLTPSRASQNVASVTFGEKPLLILSAHYDSAPTGMTFNDSAVRLNAAVQRRLKIGIGPYTLIFWPMMAALLMAALRIAGINSTAETAVLFGLTVILIISFALLIDIALSDTVPGANDNASGCACVLELVKELDGKLNNIDLGVVFPGAEEGNMLGMREWVKSHRDRLPKEKTIFLNIDTVGYGIPHYMTCEGFVIYFDYDRRLIQLCEQAASADRSGKPTASPFKYRLSSDALIPMLAGYPATTILGLDEKGFLPNYHQQSDTPENVDPLALEHCFVYCKELIENLDITLGKNPDYFTG